MAGTYTIGTAEFTADRLAPGLHIVATPIGNLGDITIRALSTLAACETLLCEDTRTTSKLLTRYGIRAKTMPYHEHNAAKMRPLIIAKLRGGEAIALVSDAGMPLVSDPGYRLVQDCIAEGIAVTAVPGASSVLTALALSGLPTDRFTFIGFLPAKGGDRKRLLREFSDAPSTLITFESPHRILDALADIGETLGHRTIAVTRELTKLHEEVLRGNAGEVAETLSARETIKGEITIVIDPPTDEIPASDEDVDSAIDDALASLPASKAAAQVAKALKLPKQDIYARILARKG
jgi:16S rRNA (cytidine1402-2'-O)-methyltransferase